MPGLGVSLWCFNAALVLKCARMNVCVGFVTWEKEVKAIEGMNVTYVSLMS